MNWREQFESEPEKLDWTDVSTGYACVMRRGPGGHWCGYIGVSKQHPWFGKSYSDVVKVNPKVLAEGTVEDIGIMNAFLSKYDEAEQTISLCCAVRCHRGLTWAKDRAPDTEISDLWWFGFDCAHSGDLCPEWSSHQSSEDAYRDVVYVQQACAKACADLKEAEYEKA